MRPSGARKAITLLARESRAGVVYHPQIKMLIEYLAISGIVSRDGDTRALGRASLHLRLC